MTIEPLTNVDTTWLRMEDPTNLMVITVLITLDDVVPFDKLRDTLKERLFKFDRFRKRIVRGATVSRSRWEEDPSLDIDHHVRPLKLAADADQHALSDAIGELIGVPLEPSRPPWCIHVVENYQGASAVVCRLHHVIADGFALLEVLLGLTDDATPDGPKDDLPGEGAERRDAPAKKGMIAKGVAAAAALARLVLLPADPATPLKGPLSPVKRAAWADGISIDQLKMIGRGRGATLNDVLLASIAGSLRSYLADHDCPPSGLEVRAVVPVNLRRPSDSKRLGNGFGLIFVPLPVGVEEPSERLRAVSRETARIKNSPEAGVALGILAGMGFATPGAQKLAVELFARKGTAVITNVPGPKRHRYLAGSRIHRIVFWVPPAGRLGMGISLFSYA